MNKYLRRLLTALAAILIGIILTTLSGSINRGRPPGYPSNYSGYVEIACDAAARHCAGDYLWGWPFTSFVGYNTDTDIRWPEYLLNILFWALVVAAVFWVVHKIYASNRKKADSAKRR